MDADTSESKEEAFDTSNNHIHHNDCRGRTKKLTTTLLLNNVEIQMEIDTGAELSTIHYSVYKEKLCNVKLEPSTTSVQWQSSVSKGRDNTYCPKGRPEPVGKICSCRGCEKPAIGRDWLRRVKLDWTMLFSGIQLQSINAVNVESIREEFPDVFKEEMGMLKG